jgi:hypothetical protein
LKNYPVEDSDESESPEALRERLRQEILKELSATLAVPKEAQPLPPEQALFVRAPDEGLNTFFEKLEEARRNRGHRA